MVTVRLGLAASAGAVAALLAALSLTGLGPVGWLVGAAAAAVLCFTVARAASSADVERLGPADLVTLGRASLTCGAAALVGDALGRPRPVAPLVALAVVALLLDLVDGQVARRTATASSFGARLDGEADAALMLVLSVALVRPVGLWVLPIGGIRYLFAATGHLAPWLRGALPFRYWRKVVTATAGSAMVLAAAQLVSRPVVVTGLVLASLLLAESFGRDVAWLWRRRDARTPVVASDAGLLTVAQR